MMYSLNSYSLFNTSNAYFGGKLLQPKLKIGQPVDKYEQEADAVADRVMNLEQTDTVQMQPIEEEEKPIQMKGANREELEMLQTKSDSGGQYASPFVSQMIQSSKGNGSPLPSDTNQFMSSAIGSNFSRVQIHTGSDSIKMNQQLDARAFTVGNDIFFNAGEYNPNSSKGNHLLSHELTHVIQQCENSKLIQKEDLDGKAISEEEKKKAGLITKIKSYGILAVEDADATFSAAELDLVDRAITAIPVSDKASIKGAKLIRVASLGSKTGGMYSNIQGYDGTSLTDDQKIELSDRAFSDNNALNSIELITHEIGHAIAAKPYRLAMSEEAKEAIKANRLLELSNVAVKEFNTANDANNSAIYEFNETVRIYNDANKGSDKVAITTAKADMATKKAAMRKLTAERSVKEADYNKKRKTFAAQKGIVKAKEAKRKAQIANIDNLKTDAAAKLVIMEQAYHEIDKVIALNDSENADYITSLTTAENAIKTFYDTVTLIDVETSIADQAKSVVDSAILDRDTKREALNKSNPQNKVTNLTSALEIAQDVFYKAATVVAFNKNMHLSVRNFYNLVISNRIAPNLTPYAAKNWPHKPEEFYAEAYSYFVNKPKDLKAYSEVLYAWFKAQKYK